MPATLDALIAKGFKFVTVSELLKMHREPAVEKKPVPARSATIHEAANAVTNLEDMKKHSPPVQEKPAQRGGSGAAGQ